MSEQIEIQPEQRLQLLNLLPQESGSLRESIQIKRLRDRIAFSEEEQEAINMDERTGSFDPQSLRNLDNKEIKLGESEREIVAAAIIKKEDEGQVPTNDAFVELALLLKQEIKEFREDLN
jgi:hypothetical protein